MNNEIKELVNEGQTQVYSDGRIDPQFGVDTNAPYLNAPPKQLLDLTAQFYNSGKTDSQVLAILVGMGIPQQLALAGIAAHKAAITTYNENNKQKNHNKMNFTLTHLYENVMKSVDVLNTMKKDNSRISYSASTAFNILENALSMFPHSSYVEYIANNADAKAALSENTAILHTIDYQNDKFALVKLGENKGNASAISVFVGKHIGVIVETSSSEGLLIEKSKRLLNELSGSRKAEAAATYRIIELTPAKINEISNFINYQKASEDTTINEDLVNPNLKFKIAKTLHRNLTQYDWLAPVSELRSYIDDMYNNTKWSFRISEAIERNELVKGQLTESLINDLNNTLKESADVKGSFTKIATKYPWSPDVKAILNEMAIADKKAFSNKAGTVSSVLSPIIENENGLNFFLNGKTYSLKDGQISESVINDSRFFSVLEGLQLFRHINNSLVIFGQNDKSLEYNLTEGTLTLGKTNLTDLNPNQIKESLLATNFFGYKNTNSADTVARFFESVELLYEMDNFTAITSNEYSSLYLTVIAVGEGVWINKVNASMQLNEMKFIPSATEAIKTIKEFINYDVTSILSERLIDEGNEAAKLTKKRTELSERISFLEENKVKVSEAIARIGTSEELTESLELLNSEISKFEKQLQETYTIVEKKTKDQYLNDGYVEANVVKASAGLKKGQTVMVNAEEYTSMGDNDLLTIIDLATEKEKIIKKGDLKVEI
jgi:hypothetical protein